MDRCGCMPLGLSLPLSCLSGLGLASQELPWLLLPLSTGLHGGGRLWMGVGVLRQPQAGDEDVACVLALASPWEAQLADSSLAELRAEQKGAAVCRASGRCCVTVAWEGGRERATGHSGPQSGNLCPACTVYSRVTTALSSPGLGGFPRQGLFNYKQKRLGQTITAVPQCGEGRHHHLACCDSLEWGN